jgi:hypothetical protein
MGITTRKLSLVGDLDGQSVTLRAGGSEYEFVDGSLEVTGPSADVDSLSKYLLRCWQAYPDPSRELDEARAALKEAPDAAQADTNEPKAGNGNPGGTKDNAGGASDPAPEPTGPDEGGSDAQPEPGAAEPGRDGEGDGQGTINKALSRLDPENDEQWTADGKPKMSAIEEAMGRSDVTRAQVNAAAPGFDRDAARAAN